MVRRKVTWSPQIMGHKPSATAERHYWVRPLDLLRQWAERYEAWILEQAGIEVPERQEPGEVLRLVETGAGSRGLV